MAAARYDFEFKDVLQALVKEAGIEEGIWQLGVEFGFAASNVASEDNVDNLKPAAMIAVNRFTLSRAERASSLTIDASSVDRG